MTSFKTIRKIFFISIITIYLLIFCWFLFFYIAPTGKMNLSYNYSTSPDFISVFDPAGRAWGRELNIKSNEYYQRIMAEPVYFHVETPRSFNTAKVTLEYRNPEQNIVELGINKAGEGNYEIKPIENKLIDNSLWEKTIDEEQNIILLQKEKKYESINEFLENYQVNPEDPDQIATYHYSLKPEVKIPDYIPQNYSKKIQTNLVGTHEMLFYVQDEDMNLDLNFTNTSTKDETKPISIKIKKDDIEILSEAVENYKHSINLTNLASGVYSINIISSEHVILDNINTNLQKIITKEKIYPDQSEDLVEIYTNSIDLNFRTWITSGLQELYVNDDIVSINKVQRLINWREQDDEEYNNPKQITIPKGNVEIIGDGYFALDQNMYFNPYPNIDRLFYYTDIEDYDFLIASNYQTPIKKISNITTTTEFDLYGVAGDRKNLDFVLSAPGLDDVNEDILVYKINIELTRENLWKRLLAKLKS
ncbi:MAG: hypothetical protein ABID45_02935 [Patescibacteria group bacterium]